MYLIKSVPVSPDDPMGDANVTYYCSYGCADGLLNNPEDHLSRLPIPDETLHDAHCGTCGQLLWRGTEVWTALEYLEKVWGYVSTNDVDEMTWKCIKENADDGYELDQELIRMKEAHGTLPS